MSPVRTHDVQNRAERERLRALVACPSTGAETPLP
jgi:hypothetical protein